MKWLTGLAARSAWNRRYALALMVLAIALATTLLLGIERLRHQVQDGFARTVSGTDLIVGARTSPVELLLYSVFHMGSVTNTLSWKTAGHIAAHPAVDWVVPLSLGDSHRGFAVVATTGTYFDHYRPASGKPLSFSTGKPFDQLYDVVIGAEIARQLGYKTGDSITLSHGHEEHDHGHDEHDHDHDHEHDHKPAPKHFMHQHDDKPFTVSGILAPTGTATDRSLLIRLEAMEALHLDWQAGAPIPGLRISPELANKFDLRPKQITALMVGLKQRSAVLAVQHALGQYPDEALTAIIPSATLDQLWQITGIGESVLKLISSVVVFVGLAGLVSSILSALGQRRRELALLRSVGARPMDILFLLTCEGVMVMASGVLLGLVLLTTGLFVAGQSISGIFGVTLEPLFLSPGEWQILGFILVCGLAACLLPALRAYRLSLSDGLTPRT